MAKKKGQKCQKSRQKKFTKIRKKISQLRAQAISVHLLTDITNIKHTQTIATSILVSDISDHFPLLITVKNSNPIGIRKDKYFYSRSYKSLDVETIKNESLSLINNLFHEYNSTPNLDIHNKFNIRVYTKFFNSNSLTFPYFPE